MIVAARLQRTERAIERRAQNANVFRNAFEADFGFDRYNALLSMADSAINAFPNTWPTIPEPRIPIFKFLEYIVFNLFNLNIS